MMRARVTASSLGRLDWHRSTRARHPSVDLRWFKSQAQGRTRQRRHQGNTASGILNGVDLDQRPCLGSPSVLTRRQFLGRSSLCHRFLPDVLFCRHAVGTAAVPRILFRLPRSLTVVYFVVQRSLFSSEECVRRPREKWLREDESPKYSCDRKAYDRSYLTCNLCPVADNDQVWNQPKPEQEYSCLSNVVKPPQISMKLLFAISVRVLRFSFRQKRTELWVQRGPHGETLGTTGTLYNADGEHRRLCWARRLQHSRQKLVGWSWLCEVLQGFAEDWF